MKFLGLFLFFISLCWAGKIPISKTIKVDISGHGNFKTVKDAINSIPVDNQQWVRIHVARGLYEEKVTVDRPFIFLQGEGPDITIIQFSDSTNTAQSFTFKVKAENFVAKSIRFVNNYNNPQHKDNLRKQAVAVMVSADKAAFYNCHFLGVQDTLWDNAGRHYYHSCLIIGCVDFIFGAGQSHYEVNGASQGVQKGYITAQSRQHATDTNGFVFKNCRLTGSGDVFLGRAWNVFARVLFYKTDLSDLVVPEGWYSWMAQGRESDTTFAESGCTGPSADKSKRVPWEKKLSKAELETLTGRSFIDAEGWIAKQP